MVLTSPSVSNPKHPINWSRIFRYILCFIFVPLLGLSIFYLLSHFSQHRHFILWSPDQSPQSTSQNTFQTTNSQQSPRNTSLNITQFSPCDKPQPPSYPLKFPPDQHLPQALLDYIAFHKTARACLLNPSCTPKPKVLITTCPKKRACLGLGDRMIGLPFALSVAIVTKRLFFIDLKPNPFPLNYGMVPKTIDWTLPPTFVMNDSWPYLEWYWCGSNKNCNAGGLFISNLTNFDNQGPLINFLTADVVSLFDDKPVVTLASRMHKSRLYYMFHNPFLNETFSDLGRKMRTREVNVYALLFQPSEFVKRQMQDVSFGVDDYVSIHVRTGVDSEEIAKKRFRYISSHEEETVENIFECLERVSGDRNITNIFVASDSQTTKKFFLEKGSKKGYAVHFSEKKILHYRDGVQWKMRPVPTDELCDGFITVYSDLFMLVGGKVMIKTGSNFASLAQHLSSNQLVVKYNPSQDVVEDACKRLSVSLI